MLNLFLAILLGNFDESRNTIEEERMKKKIEERKMLMQNYKQLNNYNDTGVSENEIGDNDDSNAHGNGNE